MPEEQYREIIHSLDDGFCILDVIFDAAGKPVDWRVLETNPKYNSLGGSPEDVGQLVSVRYPETEPFWFEFYGRVAVSGVPARLEWRLSAGDGWVEIYAFRIGGDGSRKVGVRLRDITERKKTEEALQEISRNFNALFHRKTVGLSYCKTVFDEHGDAADYIVLDVNPTYERMMGITRDKIVGKRITEAAPGLPRSLIERHNRVAITGEDTNLERYDPSTDRWYNENIFSPQKGYFIAILYDITERKRAEEALRESEAEKLRAIAAERQRFYNALEILPVMICLMTPDYQIPFANKAFRERYGEAAGRHCYEYCYGYTEPCAFCESLLPLQTKKPHQWVLASPDGSTITAVHDIPFHDIDGNTLILELGIDITERRKASDALRKSEQRARELVAELEEADRNKNQFISVLSHELRNPLAVIVASLSLLEIACTPEQISLAKESINRQVRQLTKLVDDLLELTRIRQNRIKLKKESINLGELLENMSRDMNLAYREKGVRLHVELPEEPLFLDADPVRIAQCAGNLLQNALDFTPAQGEVTLSLAYEKEEAVIRVRDNGVGISPDLLEHIFTPFTQSDTTLDRTNSGGLGLGLSIVDGIVRMHGGRVTAFSEGEGKGALFTIRLPAAAQPGPARNSCAAQKRIRNFRILVIDDKRELTDILCAILGAMGHRARAAYDGYGGIAAAKEMRPDVIFCDIGLPGRSGYEVAEILKADRELKSAYLIALTGYAGEDEKERAKAAGFDRHLSKPLDRAALEKVLAEVYGRPG